MSTPIFLLCLVIILIASIHAIPIPKGYLLNCGSNEDVEEGALKYIPDDGYVSVGNKTSLNRKDILPTLQTLRFFPNEVARKYCYNIPVIKGGKYIVKTIYFYGRFDGRKEPPVFDQIIDGTKWSMVNTTDDYASGAASFYEAIVMAQDKFLSVCLARNYFTAVGSSPFISSLEVHPLDASVYNTTDLEKNMLVTVARTAFGDHDMISFPDDKFNRNWQPFTDHNPHAMSHATVDPSTFWNIPPQMAFTAALTASNGKTLTLNWPQFSLMYGRYYIVLYFQDNRTPSPYSWRVFDIQINGHKFYNELNVTDNGVSVYGTDWPLGGQTEITLIPSEDTPVGPLINAGEIFLILPSVWRTFPSDVTGMNELKKYFINTPEGWSGDPCLPLENSWSGVSCSNKPPYRILALNLASFGLSGSLAQGVSKLTGLKQIWLGSNNVSGTIPDLSALTSLEFLHLDSNQFEGPIPESLGQLPNLHQLYLQNNKFIGDIPEFLKNRQDLTVQW